MEGNDSIVDGGQIVYEDSRHGISEDVQCFVSLREKHDSKIFCCDDCGGLKGNWPVMALDVPRCSCTKHSNECITSSIHNSKKRTCDNIRQSNKRRCLRTSVFGQLRINESSPGKKYYNGFEKIISDGSIEKYVLGDRVYLLPSSVYEEMYIAQIESIYEEYGKVYVHCHWFERLEKNEVRLTNISDINPIDCIEGKCIILRNRKGTNLYCKNNFTNGWFYN